MQWSNVGALDFGLLPRPLPSTCHVWDLAYWEVGREMRCGGVEWSAVPSLHVSAWILLPGLGMVCERMTPSPPVLWPPTVCADCTCWGEGNVEVSALRPVVSTPPGECPHVKPIPNPHDTPFSSTGRQLIQKLRVKEEKKSFRMKEKKAEMQGESAGEQARGKGLRSWNQTQQQKYKATATHASKQVNLDGRGASVPCTLPRLGPIRGWLPRRPLLRAQTH